MIICLSEIVALFNHIDLSSEAIDQMQPGSPFLNDLNSRPFPDGVSFTSIKGKMSLAFLYCPGNDCLVSPHNQDLSLNVTNPLSLHEAIESPFIHTQESLDVNSILYAMGALDKTEGPIKSLVRWLVESGSPIDLEVTDPQGRKISKQSTGIPAALYNEIETDGEIHDVIRIPFGLPGNYGIKIIPEPGSSLLDTYSLKVRRDGVETVLAQNRQIKDIPTQGYTVTVSKQLKSLAPTKLWVGLKNSDDQGTFFDVRVDVLKNGSVIASGVSKNIQGVTRNPDQAKEVTVGFGSISNGEIIPGDVLSLRVSAKVADSGGHNNAVGLRLYYDAVSRPSRFGAEITPDPLKSFFLRTVTGDFLDSTALTSKTPKQKDSPGIDRKTFKEIGTWSMTVQ